MIEQTLAAVQNARLVAILRHVPPHRLEDTLAALYRGGVRCVEITANSDDALQCVRIAAQNWGDRLIIGGGTILDHIAAREYANTGAAFLLSPILDRGMIETSLECGVLPVPGVFTPTEAYQAFRLGAPLLKLFPAITAGTDFFSQMRAPLPQLRFMAVGGVDLNNAASFLQAGVVALGVGSHLADAKLIAEGDFSALENRAALWVRTVAEDENL